MTNSIVRILSRQRSATVIRRVAIELGLVPSDEAGNGYTWNGYPVSFDLITKGEESTPSWLSVKILAQVSGPLLVRRTSSWIARLHRFLGRKLSYIAPALELTGDEELRARLVSDAVMTKTLPLALARPGEEIRISDGRLRVSRFIVDGAEEDALKAAWSLTTSVIQSLKLPPPEKIGGP